MLCFPQCPGQGCLRAQNAEHFSRLCKFVLSLFKLAYINHGDWGIQAIQCFWSPTAAGRGSWRTRWGMSHGGRPGALERRSDISRESPWELSHFCHRVTCQWSWFDSPPLPVTPRICPVQQGEGVSYKALLSSASWLHAGLCRGRVGAKIAESLHPKEADPPKTSRTDFSELAVTTVLCILCLSSLILRSHSTL